MIAYLIEFKMSDKSNWLPAGIAGTIDGDTSKLLDRVRESLTILHNRPIRLRPFRRLPGARIESSTLGGIPVIYCEGDNEQA